MIPDLIINVPERPSNDNCEIIDADIQLNNELKKAIEDFEFLVNSDIELARMALDGDSPASKLYFLSLLTVFSQKMTEATLTGRWS